MNAYRVCTVYFKMWVSYCSTFFLGTILECLVFYNLIFIFVKIEVKRRN